MSAASSARKIALLFAACSVAAAGLVGREGWVLKGYPDPVLGAKLPTACAGVTEGVQLGRAYGDDECVLMTAQAMLKHAGPILPCVRDDFPATGAAYLSEMVTMSYNIGTAGFLGSSMCRQMKAGAYGPACDAILGWYKSGGVDCRDPNNRVCRGLWTDRQRQHAQCLKALP